MAALDTVHRAYYREQPFLRTFWQGIPIAKCPLDAWVLQEIVHETKPDLIIETGSYYGGSALYLAHLLDLQGHGQILSIDIEPWQRPAHPRISWVTGSSIAPEITRFAATRATGKRTMVILDSDHRKKHVAAELAAYAPLVTDGCYLVVEDTNMGGNPVEWDQGAGPAGAVKDFLAANTDFEIDRECEKHLLTFAPGGWLRRREE